MPPDALTRSRSVTGPRLVTGLRLAGVTLHLTPDGTLHLRPPPADPDLRAAVQAHLPTLLLCAAVDEVQRLLNAMEDWSRFPTRLWDVRALNDACLTGDVDATRREALAYVARWQRALEGGAAQRPDGQPG